MNESVPASERLAEPSPGRALFSKIGLHPQGEYVEVGWNGEPVAAGNAALYAHALSLKSEIERIAPDVEADIVLCFESVLDFIPAVWACVFAGRSCLPWHVLWSQPAAKAFDAKLSLLRKKLHRPVLLTTEQLLGKMSDAHKTAFAAIVVADRGARPGTPVLLQAPPDSAGTARREPAGFLLPTSGTTSEPKIAVVSYANTLNRLIVAEKIGKGRRVIGFGPFDSVGGSAIAFLVHPLKLYLQPERLAASPADLFSLIETYRIQAAGFPSSIAALVCDAAENGATADLSSLEHVGFGAEMIVPDVVRRLMAACRRMGARGLKTSFGFGMTETGLVCATREFTPEEAEEHFARSRDAPILGTCNPGYSLRVVGEAGDSLASGTVGEIQVRGEGLLFSGYRDDPELNAQSFAADGWFRTGDRGVLENDELRILGRQKSTIIVNGRNIALEQLEAPLRALDGLKRGMLAAVPVRQAGSATDELALFFVPNQSDARTLDALCNSMLREVARSAGVRVKHFFPLQESEIPLTATGKMHRRLLAERFAEGRLTPYRPTRSPQNERADPP